MYILLNNFIVAIQCLKKYQLCLKLCRLNVHLPKYTKIERQVAPPIFKLHEKHMPAHTTTPQIGITAIVKRYHYFQASHIYFFNFFDGKTE